MLVHAMDANIEQITFKNRKWSHKKFRFFIFILHLKSLSEKVFAKNIVKQSKLKLYKEIPKGSQKFENHSRIDWSDILAVTNMPLFWRAAPIEQARSVEVIYWPLSTTFRDNRWDEWYPIKYFYFLTLATQNKMCIVKCVLLPSCM